MLEIFDENGELTLSVDDNTTKIIAVYRRKIHKGSMPTPLLSDDELKAMNHRPFIVSNTLYDLSKGSVHDIHQLFKTGWNDKQELVDRDVVVLGVYGV
ncbi:Uncharacterised protein [Moraxella lacunata]|uniref:Uncharacterized protein n=1 Tax=Moraxella lacunata TaxID=477 RepID=A0A378T4A0_MORLA|nr:hypothetical protein [Moraxella lacunata]STZ55609.1 Uncharacterised protein [Moraxella lacunata]